MPFVLQGAVHMLKCENYFFIWPAFPITYIRKILRCILEMPLRNTIVLGKKLLSYDILNVMNFQSFPEL